MHLHGRLHDQRRQEVVRHVLGDDHDDQGLKGKQRALEESEHDGKCRRDEGPHDRDEMRDARDDADKTRIGVAEKSEAGGREDAICQRGNDHGAHIAAHGARHDREHERGGMLVALAGNRCELPHHDRIVLREPVGKHEPQEECHDIVHGRHGVRDDAVRDLVHEILRDRGAKRRERRDALREHDLGTGVVGRRIAAHEIGDLGLELLDIGRNRLQQVHELLDEGRHHDDGQAHERRYHDNEGDEGSKGTSYPVIFEPVRDGAADEAEDDAHKQKLEGRADEAKQPHDKYKRHTAPDDGSAYDSDLACGRI